MKKLILGLILLTLLFICSSSVFASGPKYTIRQRFGVGMDQHHQDNSAGRKIDEFQWQQLGIGWYFDWGAGQVNNGGPRDGLEYIALVGGYRKGTPNCNTYRNLATNKSKYPDYMSWMIGNEIGLDDGRTANEYASDFVKWYTCLKSINPTFKVGSGALVSLDHQLPPNGSACAVNPSESGRQYFKDYINEIKRLDPSKLPDFIVNHAYTFCRPGGITIANFKAEISEQRQLMKNLGLQNKDLIINEWSDLSTNNIQDIITYLNGTVNYLMTATDQNVGNPDDEYRLVQKWAWFVLNDWQGGKYSWQNVALADTYGTSSQPGELRQLGLTYKALIPNPTPIPHPGDLNHDGKVDISDYNLMVQNFGGTTCGNIADTDGTCKVDIFDYNTLVQNFGKSQ